MRKDKNKSEQQGKITIIEHDPSYDMGWVFVNIDGSRVNFSTTEDAKRWLRANGSSPIEYKIIQAKATIELQQETITKLVSVQSD